MPVEILFGFFAAGGGELSLGKRAPKSYPILICLLACGGAGFCLSRLPQVYHFGHRPNPPPLAIVRISVRYP
jgi:hypothetical protein